MRSQDVRELLQIITRQQPLLVDRNNIFDQPARLYLMLKTMFQNYKKQHELQIMQARVFNIELGHSAVTTTPPSRVSPRCLFQYHQLSEADVLLLIDIKNYLQQDSKQELYLEILRGIEQQERVAEYMKCYRTLLNQEYFNKDFKLYQVIEEKMVNKLLTLSSVDSRDVRLISHYLAGLPRVSRQILTLISKLYERVNKLKDFVPLFIIFNANFPERPQFEDVQSLVRICLPETIEKFKELLSTRPDLREGLMRAAREEAINKLKTMQLTKTSKTVPILNFIVEAVKLGIPIWQEIIEWEHRAAQGPKNILKNSLEGILVGMLGDLSYLRTVIEIVQKITEIDQHSQIGLIFVRQLLRLERREFLAHRVIRRFLAIKILKYNSSEQYLVQILDQNFRFIEVILEMFSYRGNALNFYQHLLNSQHLPSFQNYLARLSAELPLKFKDFFLRCLQSDAEKGELLGSPSSPMLKMLCEQVSGEMGASLVKDLSGSPPFKSLLIIFTKLLSCFKDSKQLLILKANVARTLNIMLIRTPKGEINRTFQWQLPLFIKEHLFQKIEQIFLNVSTETKDELKRNYDSFCQRKGGI